MPFLLNTDFDPTPYLFYIKDQSFSCGEMVN